jgi:multisubunit Na+/H+ antiporter MnhB subunit
MKRAVHFASGVSVLFTTLAFGHLMQHEISHEVAEQGFAHPFVAFHAIFVVTVGVLSLTGAFLLLTGKRRQTNPN